MKYTHLQLVQKIMSSMSADEVNSINDTTESMQVSEIIQNTFYDIVERANLPELYAVFNLTASGDNDKPVLMTLPAECASVGIIKYDKQTNDDTVSNYQDLKYLDLNEFLDRSYAMDPEEDGYAQMTHTVNGYSITFTYRTDKAPDYYTTFDDNTLLFDSYDSEVDTTLQSSKTLVHGRKNWTYTLSNTFVPPFDDALHQILLNESKATAWAELRQTTNARAERSAARGWVALQRTQDTQGSKNEYQRLPNYGRK